MATHINRFNESANCTCEKLCKECPFSKESIKGWLADYTVDDFKDMMNKEQLFPCHMLMPDRDLNNEDVQELIENGEIKLCRGYVESMIKSCKLPKFNKTLLNEVNRIKKEGVSDKSMAIWDFMKHHNK